MKRIVKIVTTLIIIIFVLYVGLSGYKTIVSNPINPEDITVEAYMDSTKIVIFGMYGDSFSGYEKYESRIEKKSIYFKFYYGLTEGSTGGPSFYIVDNGEYTNIEKMYIEDEYGHTKEIDYSKTTIPEDLKIEF